MSVEFTLDLTLPFLSIFAKQKELSYPGQLSLRILATRLVTHTVSEQPTGVYHSTLPSGLTDF